MPISRGDVVLVPFPDSNRRTAKRWPALIVQADHLETEIPQGVLAMISSNMARAGHGSRVSVAMTSVEGKQMGLRTDFVVMTDNLATVREGEIYRNLGKLRDMSSVDAALRNTLGL